MSDSILRTQSKEFTKKIILLNKDLRTAHTTAALMNQFLRSGTSIGANIHEAQYPQGSADFISKLEIALKEANETEYWLELLMDTGYITSETHRSLQKDYGAIRRMLISSCKTIKER